MDQRRIEQQKELFIGLGIVKAGNSLLQQSYILRLFQNSLSNVNTFLTKTSYFLSLAFIRQPIKKYCCLKNEFLNVRIYFYFFYQNLNQFVCQAAVTKEPRGFYYSPGRSFQ